jgi:NitT/TauT family transport system substrate-binding protein
VVATAALVLGAVSPSASWALDKVTVGHVGTNSDAGFLIAEAKGYFTDAGIEIVSSFFDTSAKMVAPLGTGDLEVGSGPTSAGLFNAVARGIGIKAVADRARMAPGYNFMTLMLRRELVESGKYKSFQDLKGLKIALAAPGISLVSVLNEAAKKGGLNFADVEKVYMSYPQQVTALANGAIDGSIMNEPFGTMLLTKKIGSVVASTEDFYPALQISMMYYSERLIKDRPDVARRFMVGYIRALRDYNDVIDKGQIAKSKKGDEIAALLAKALDQKIDDIRASYLPAVDPDGRPNLDSVAKDLAFFKTNGDLTNPAMEVAQIMNLSFLEAALKEVGPYKPNP